ncbi:MAG: hypothetical protein JW717_01950 [Marinilabiliaceae bacterium]|nr:hypothetical protein [Marinilabiliaceae bacterium]
MRKKIYVLLIAISFFIWNGVTAETVSYDFRDGSIITNQQSTDGLLTLGGAYNYHGASYGLDLKVGQVISVKVSGSCTFKFLGSQYSSLAMKGSAIADGDLGTKETKVVTDLSDTYEFIYSGGAATITFTAVLNGEGAGSDIYLPLIEVIYTGEVDPSNGKIDVWDFGAQQLPDSMYNNQLSIDSINSWYSGTITPGSSGNALPSFTAGVLSWSGGSNDRLRTTNTSLTRYDENVSGVTGYTGRIYVNSQAATGRYLSLNLSEDDEVTLAALSQSGFGQLNFVYAADANAQTDVVSLGTDLAEYSFVAKQSGIYHVYDTQDKPSYYRVYRKDAVYNTVSGVIDTIAASGIPSDFGIVFENEAGKVWSAAISGNTYTVDLPVGYFYELSLTGANGFIINSEAMLNVVDTTSTLNVNIQSVELYTVSGKITGLGSDVVNAEFVFSPDPAANKIFMPEVLFNSSDSSYSVELEPNCEYTISVSGVNDYYIPLNTVTITGAQTLDVNMVVKPTYSVAITAIDRSTGNALTPEQLAPLSITFTNLNEEGYVYNFASIDDVVLRDGVYSIYAEGIDALPLVLAPTSNLTIVGESTSKELLFDRSVDWVFKDINVTNPTSYKGLLFTGSVSVRGSNGDLYAGGGATIKIPVKMGEKVFITDYYLSDYIIEGSDTITNDSKNTSTKVVAEYLYKGTEDGYVELAVLNTSYLLSIKVVKVVDFAETIYVGNDKEYKTINEALNAIAMMNRPNQERVTVMIDPGNYEEMLVINQPNVSFVNASLNPSIGLLNKGVDIAEGAVRITSYYGTGYNYFSMNNDQKWNADVLRVNKENGYLSYENMGDGTTNGSYWNATVVVNSKGFEAENIIFENSFNQYISLKESQDSVVMWTSGSRGERPTDYGNTSVQDKSFVERAAAIAVAGGDKIVLNNCRVVGRQDSFYGANGVRVVVYKGAMMGAVDYLFGGMVAVFYKTDLVMNTSDNGSDAAYLTAAYQESGRGYLMYECNVKSTVPGVETASTMTAKPGYFGRPWKPVTSEVVFYNTTVDTSGYTGYVGKSLISPEGWSSSLGGESAKMYEFGTVELSGENNLLSRASWSTVLSIPTLTDGVDISTFNFTKGSDNWDPIPALIANDPTGIYESVNNSSANISAVNGRIYITNVKSVTTVNIFSINGSLIASYKTNGNSNYPIEKGVWIVNVINSEGSNAIKVIVK